jgi:hypothetical protein
MRKRRWWIAAALTVAVAVMVAVVVSARRLLQPSTVAGSTYHPSDPARLATTGRPQLVEFFHHA